MPEYVTELLACIGGGYAIGGLIGTFIQRFIRN